MKLEWRLTSVTNVPAELLLATGGLLLVARILMARGMRDPDDVRRFLDPAAAGSTPPAALHDLTRGAERVERAIADGERVLVWGDFDVDGQTSTALLVSALVGLGGQVDYHIPIREKESHGIRSDVLQTYLDEGLGLLLTCDTGIASVDAVDTANAAGVDVVVTDHHDLPEELPRALALINPKFHLVQEPDHPLRGLPGVGVAYKLAEALYQSAGREEELESFLDLVALGIVADLAIQEEDSRSLLQRGLQVLRNTDRPGLLELMRHGGVEAEFLNDEDIGFQIGPRLNAVGRLADANVSVSLLTTLEQSEAAEIADHLERLNEDRKFETQVVFDSAVEQIERDSSLLQYAALVMANDHWHQGVIGIVASRLVEEYGKPTFLFSLTADGLARGSARSVEGYHITEAISTQREILHGFGGHPMAAGLSLNGDDVDAFRRGVSRAIIEQRRGRLPEPTLDIELELSLAELTLETATELESLAPFGPGNPHVNILMRGIEVVEAVEIGKDRSHRRLTVADSAGVIGEVLWWGGASEALSEGRVDMVVRVRLSSFRGKRTLMTTLQDLRPAGEAELLDADRSGAVIVDCRDSVDSDARLREVLGTEPGAQVWGEVIAGEDLRTREQLTPGEVLVIWTLPPDHRALNEVIAAVGAQRIYVFAVDPAIDEYDSFIQRFAGLVKFAIEQYGGTSTVARFAAALGHTEGLVIQGLQVLPALGVQALCTKNGELNFEPREPRPAPQAENVLRLMLHESCAFRRAFRDATEVEHFFD